MSNCSRFIIPESYEDITIYKDLQYVAKKTHVCCECNKTIIPGEKYRYTWGVRNKKSQVYKRCIDCQSIADAYFCDTVSFTRLNKELMNVLVYLGKDKDLLLNEDCIKDLTKTAKERIFEMIEKFRNGK